MTFHTTRERPMKRFFPSARSSASARARLLSSLLVGSFAVLLPVIASAQASATPMGAGDAGTPAVPDKSGAGLQAGSVSGEPTGVNADGAGAAAAAPAKPTAASEADAPKKSDETLQTGTAGARAVGSAPAGTNYGNFMDTRLTWTFGDDDFLHRTGEITPISPSFGIGDRPQYRLFFDNLNSRFSGRENITHLVMYKRMPAFIANLTTEAALVLRFDLAQLSAQTNNVNSALYDAGSYIRLFYNTDTAKAKTGLSAVFFPLDTDRFRLGYLYDISWGGTASNINQSIFPRIQGASPGMKMQFDGDGYYFYGGFKTATIIQPQQVLSPGGESEVETVRVGEVNYGVLGGGGADLGSTVRFELGAGYFQQGKFDLEDVRGKSVYTYGASGRVVVHHKMPVPQSVDFVLYRNDPSAPQVLFAPEKYDANEFAVAVSGELSLLNQHLKDFDRSGATKDQGALAGALQSVFKVGYARLSVTALY